MDNSNQYITWKSFLNILVATIIGMGTLVGGAATWGWSETHNEIQNVEVRLNSQVQRIEDKLDTIIDHLINDAHP